MSGGNIFIVVMILFWVGGSFQKLMRGECVDYIQGIQQCGWSAWVGVGMFFSIGVVLIVYEGRKLLNRKRKHHSEKDEPFL